MKHGLLDPTLIQRMLYETLDHSDDIVLVLEQSGGDRANLKIASANDVFCRTSGYSHEDLIGRDFRLCSPRPSKRFRLDQVVRSASDEGSARSGRRSRS